MSLSRRRIFDEVHGMEIHNERPELRDGEGMVQWARIFLAQLGAVNDGGRSGDETEAVARNNDNEGKEMNQWDYYWQWAIRNHLLRACLTMCRGDQTKEEFIRVAANMKGDI